MEELLLSAIELYGINDVRQIEMNTTEPLVPESSSFKVYVATEKLKGYKSPGIDQILEELIPAGGTTLHFEIQKLINSIWNK
jgi:hypothetical protein